MIGALAGAGLGAIGTGFQMYGAHEQHKAMADALAKYSSAHNGYLNNQDQQDSADAAYSSDMAHRRQLGLTEALNGYTAAPPSGQGQAEAMGQLVSQNKLNM